MLDEYLVTNEKKSLETAMTTYIHDLIPERESLQRLRFDIVEMEVADNMSILHQYDVDPRKTVKHYGEEPTVQKFVV